MQILKLRFVIVAVIVFLFAALSGGAQVVKTIHSFTGTDGEYPDVVVLAQGADGRLYGTTSAGGANGMATVFKQGISRTGTIVIHNFAGPEGSSPGGGLTLGSDGNFYGAAPGGGDLWVRHNLQDKLGRCGHSTLQLHRRRGR